MSNLPNWKDLLDLMEVPDSKYKNIFLLGNYSKHVTIYSQQVRAINLVEALYQVKKINSSTRIAVVGAGIAGVTFSKGAVLKGANVWMIEKRYSDAIGLQFNNRQRWVHPFVYDWPVNNIDLNRTDLPFLNWDAATTDQVALTLRNEWIGFRDDPMYKPKIKEFYQAEAIKVKGNLDNEGITVSWNHSKTGNMELEFDIVVLAVGFGVEEEILGKWSYWSEDNIDSVINPKDSWLISGYGDGSLTDVMRLCVKDFRHDSIVNEFLTHPEAIACGKDLLDFENSSQSNNISRLRDKYKSLNIEPLKDVLRERLRNINVCVNCTLSNLYSKKSSILNRLIISQLDRLNAFKICDEGKISNTKYFNNRFEIVFESGQNLTFDHVLLRHGPQSVLKSEFEDIYQKSETLRRKWDNISYIDDITRNPIWERDSFANIQTDYFSTRHQFVQSSKNVWNLSSDLRSFPIIIGHDTQRGRKSLPQLSSDYAFLDDFGDIDAMFEVMIYLARLYPDSNLKKVTATLMSEADLAASPLIVIGGPLGNDYGIGGNWVTGKLNELILKNIKYDVDEAPMMLLNDKSYFTEYSPENGSITKDFGVIMRCQSPWNPQNRILCFQGIHTFGGLGAVMALTDASQNPYNCNLILNRFGSDPLFYAKVNVDVKNGNVLPPVLGEEDLFPLN